MRKTGRTRSRAGKAVARHGSLAEGLGGDEGEAHGAEHEQHPGIDHDAGDIERQPARLARARS